MHHLAHWPQTGRPCTRIRLRAVVGDQRLVAFCKEDATNITYRLAEYMLILLF